MRRWPPRCSRGSWSAPRPSRRRGPAVPLYDARIALEDLTLPSDPTARLEAEIAQAQGRVAELADAVSRGDWPAVEAAARAYGRTLDDLDDATGQPALRALAAVQFHQAVLLRLLGTAPSQALAGIEQALDRSGTVIARLDAISGGQPEVGVPAEGIPQGGGQGAGRGQGTGSGTGTGSGRPATRGGGERHGRGRPGCRRAGRRERRRGERRRRPGR